jgi:hypothetical protein
MTDRHAIPPLARFAAVIVASIVCAFCLMLASLCLGCGAYGYAAGLGGVVVASLASAVHEYRKARAASTA